MHDAPAVIGQIICTVSAHAAVLDLDLEQKPVIIFMSTSHDSSGWISHQVGRELVLLPSQPSLVLLLIFRVSDLNNARHQILCY